MAILAVQVFRKMRGGSQSQLTLGTDGNLWVVKFQNNPQHVRVLANEMIATRLAAFIGLTVPATDIIDVPPYLVANTPDMYYEARGTPTGRYAAGLQFGSRFVGGLLPGSTVDYLPDEQLEEVSNISEFAGVLCLDKWTGNCDGRQAVFTRRATQRKYQVTFVDQGFCFNAGDWKFQNAPLHGIYARKSVYAKVTGWESFEPWLTRIEHIEQNIICEITEAVPPEWYGGDEAALERLVKLLLCRRSRVRELITSFRYSDRAPFPNWV